jgi:PAS domain-containing protein
VAPCLESAAGISPEDERRYRTIRFGQFMCGTVAATRMPLIALDLQRSSLECGSELRQAGVQAYAGYPLISHDRLLGTLAFATSKRSHLNADELSLMQTLSVQVAAVLERNRLCRSLRASEQAAQRHLALLQNVYSTAPVGLCFLDPDLRYVSINETLARITGRPVSEHLGRTLGEFIPEATPFKDLCERVLETEQEVTNCELRVARPEGDHDWLVSVHPVRGTRAPRGSPWGARSRPTWCSATSGCRGWMGMPSRARCAPIPPRRGPTSSLRPGTATRKIAAAPGRRGSICT